MVRTLTRLFTFAIAQVRIFDRDIDTQIVD